MATSNTTTTADLRKTVQALEKLQADAASNKHQFLAYLPDMARMEAVSLLSKQRQES